MAELRPIYTMKTTEEIIEALMSHGLRVESYLHNTLSNGEEIRSLKIRYGANLHNSGFLDLFKVFGSGSVLFYTNDAYIMARHLPDGFLQVIDVVNALAPPPEKLTDKLFS